MTTPRPGTVLTFGLGALFTALVHAVTTRLVGRVVL